MLIGMVLFGACRSEDVYKEGTVDTAETLRMQMGMVIFLMKIVMTVRVRFIPVQKSCVTV